MTPLIIDGRMPQGKRFYQTNVVDTSQYDSTCHLHDIRRKLADDIAQHILSDPKFFQTESYPDMIGTRLECVVFTHDEVDKMLVEQYMRGKNSKQYSYGHY